MAVVGEKTRQELASVRDTVESIWVAIVLAFVLRAFVVEAFVIPTGSMAPRLFGEHLDLQCPQCGYEYAFGWSNEQRGYGPGSARVDTPKTPINARCPNCGCDRAPPEFLAGGDRVLVMKYLYRFREPEPWDVVVFKNPQDNRQNYIKRLIGLPGETIEIVHGNVFVSHDGGKTFRIRRKTDPKVQRAMWHVAFDNDYRPTRPANPTGLPGAENLEYPEWRPEDQAADALWDLSELGGRRFRFKDAKAPASLSFRPTTETFLPRYGYNAGLHSDRQLDVISDLKLETTFIPQAADSLLALTLTSFEHAFRGEIAASGAVRLLYRPDDGNSASWSELASPARLAPMKVGRGCEVALAHVDQQVVLWVDGEAVLVSRERDSDGPDDRQKYPMDYKVLKTLMAEARKQSGSEPIPTPRVKIEASGGACRLSHIRLLRDVYYTSPRLDSPPDGPAGDFARRLGVRKNDLGWGTADRAITLTRYPDRPDLDQFFVMGDNSPSSLDGRLWTSAAPTLRLYAPSGSGNSGRRLYQLGTVPRYNMIGKAIFVYWPSGFRVPMFPSLPILPNVGRMRLIR